MNFEIDQAEIWKSAFMAGKLIASFIPWWFWLIIGLGFCFSLFFKKR